MKQILVFTLGLVLSVQLCVADESTRVAQEALKAKGFYFGELDGELTAPTAAALKRFQIRNGLEVTGTLTPESAAALGNGSENPDGVPAAPSAPIPAPVPERAPIPAPETPSRPLGRSSAGRVIDEDADRDSAPRPTVRANPGGMSNFFARTPFASAPQEVQVDTVRKAQKALAKEGVYHEAIDGQAGAALEEALLVYQKRAELPLSGRLDLETLSLLRLLPGRGGPVLKPFNEKPVGRPDGSTGAGKVYRGVLVR